MASQFTLSTSYRWLSCQSRFIGEVKVLLSVNNEGEIDQDFQSNIQLMTEVLNDNWGYGCDDGRYRITEISQFTLTECVSKTMAERERIRLLVTEIVRINRENALACADLMSSETFTS